MNSKIDDIILEFHRITATSGSYRFPNRVDTYMTYGKICECDSGFMCDHRSYAIGKWLEQEMKSLIIDATIKALD